MGIVSNAADVYYAYRFIKILTTPWEEMDAYELGIIDDNGKVLKKSRQLRSSDEKKAYTVFHRLVFSIKRLLEKLPGGRTVLASYAAALFLLKETTDLNDEQIGRVLDTIGIDITNMQLDENISEKPWFINKDTREISPGAYDLTNEVLSPRTAEVIGSVPSKVIVHENCKPIGSVFGIDIYKVTHSSTSEEVYITSKDIRR